MASSSGGKFFSFSPKQSQTSLDVAEKSSKAENLSGSLRRKQQGLLKFSCLSIDSVTKIGDNNDAFLPNDGRESVAFSSEEIVEFQVPYSPAATSTAAPGLRRNRHNFVRSDSPSGGSLSSRTDGLADSQTPGQPGISSARSGGSTRTLRMFNLTGISDKCNSSLGSLNPELYKCPEEGDITDYPEGHIGRLWFTVDFDRANEKLAVSIGKIRNLQPREGSASANALDPFVRVYLLPDERRHVQTKIKRKTTNPNFNETLQIEMSKDTFQERIIKFVAFDIDPLQRCAPIGAVTYSLMEYTMTKQQKFTTWKDLVKDEGEAGQCQMGELHCSVMFNANLERLSLTIIAGKDLHANSSSGPDNSEETDSYCRVSLLTQNKAVGKPKKTKIIKRTQTERQIGRLTLGGSMYARGKPLEHWMEMISKPKEYRSSGLCKLVSTWYKCQKWMGTNSSLCSAELKWDIFSS